MPYVTRPRRRRGPPIGGPYPGVFPLLNIIRFSATMQTFITVPQIASGQSVAMDVYPTNGNTGLPSGAPSVTNNVWQTITFTLTAAMDYIGRNGSSYFDGFIKNVNGSGRVYPLDDTLINSNVIRNSAATLGSELIPTLDFTSGWLVAGGGSASSADTITTTSAGGLHRVLLTVGSTYTITVDATVTGTTGTIINTAGQSAAAIGSLNGVNSYTFTATDTSLYFRLSGAGSAQINSISLRESPGYGTASASLSAQFSESYQVIDVGFLQVANAIVNGNFESGTGWNLGNGWSIASGVASHIAGSGNNNQSILANPAPFESGAEYRWGYDLTSYTSGSVHLQSGGSIFTGSSASAIGSYSGDYTVSAISFGARSSFSQDFTGSIDNLTAHRLLRNITP